MYIKTMVESYLDGNTLPNGYSIENMVETSKNAVQTLGNITLRDNSTRILYLVEYQSLVSLHGSGVDDLNIVTAVTPISTTT